MTEQQQQTRAAVAVIESDGYAVGYADRDVPGYTPTTYAFASYDEAKRCASEINRDAFNLTPEQVAGIVLSSMRGTR